MRAAINAALKLPSTKLKPDEWDAVHDQIILAAETEDAPPEQTQEGRAHAWLTDFLTRNKIVLSGLEVAQSTLQPWRDTDGAIWIFSTQFMQFATTQADHPTFHEVTTALRALGCFQQNIYIRQSGSRTRRSTWRLPYNPLETAAAPP